jgi:2-phospho-L-lactate/phosphoenolpyruvate guanylyltransferase
MAPGSYVVLLPVKPPGVGKTRLRGLPREVLASAFAMDTATAALGCPMVAQVLAVTDDASFASSLTDLGCAAIPDGVSGDLNASLALAAMEAARRWPDLVPVAICADLPCLESSELTLALGQRDGWPRFVADAVGEGTTLYTAPIDEFAPRFGPASAAAHAASGAWPVEGDLGGLRHDVDEWADLVGAVRRGVGAHTAAAVASLDLSQMP